MRALHPLALGALLACASTAPFEGLAPSQDTGGPTVRFDLAARPFAEIPFPNDIAARPDDASPTGLRVNVSLAASAAIEASLRGELDRLDGFGTFAPITVSFDRDIDVLDLWARQNDADPTNDGVYLIDLTDGRPYALDLNGGHFPAELPDPVAGEFLGDPLAGVTNLLFDVNGPGPNFLHPPDPGYFATHGLPQASDDLLTFYERSTHTLILRPLLPLPQRHRFAVVLTRRIRDAQGRAITSPFSGIHHAVQTAELSDLPGRLPAGVDLRSDVAFAWAFTTQSVTQDLERIRDGLLGVGPMRDLSLRFPVAVGTGGSFNLVRMRVFRVEDSTAIANPFVLTAPRLKELFNDARFAAFFGSPSGAALTALEATYDYVDYFVFGQFFAPDLLFDPDRQLDATFQLGPRGTAARAASAAIPFALAVPKKDAGRDLNPLPPFPVALVGHTERASRLEGIFAFAGTFAKFGVASIGVDAYRHGLGLSPTDAASLRTVLASHGLGALGDGLLATRAQDLDGDGLLDPGGDLFSQGPFHTRDAIRQSVVDLLQLVRLIKAFDGSTAFATPPLDLAVPGSGILLRAGDFNGDGVPDIGGPAIWPSDVYSLDGRSLLFPAGTTNPGSDVFAFGVSLGSTLATLLAALEPAVKAGVAVSPAGGLTDVALRTVDPALKSALRLPVQGPLLATCAFSPSAGACAPAPDAQPALVWQASDLNRPLVAPIALLALGPGDLVIACNLAQIASALPPDGDLAARAPQGCRRAMANSLGNLRLPLAADGPLLLSQGGGGVQAIRSGDPFHVVIVPAQGGAARAIDSFQIDFTAFGRAYGPSAAATDPAAGRLQAIASGFGAERNTPAFRRYFTLAQAALEPGDPINYAPHLLGDLLPARGGVPPSFIVMPTAGDPAVPTSAGIALARAAGLVELAQADPAYGMTDDQVLTRGAVVEGIARLPRFAASPPGSARIGLGQNLVCDASSNCNAPVLLDPSGLSCDPGVPPSSATCRDGFNAPRLSPPLVGPLVRTTLGAGGVVVGKSALIVPYLSPTGQHGFGGPQPQKAFNLDQYLANLTGRYFASRGRELRLEPCQQFLAACPWIRPP